MQIRKLFGGKALAVALAFAMVPASIAIPQSAPVVGSIIGTSEAQAQYYGGGRGHYRGGPRYVAPRGHHRNYRSNRRSNSGAVIGGAIAGIAAGAIIAGAANSQPRYVQQAPVQYRPQPWTQEWYQYCSQRYRSFDPRSGTFQPYNGPRRMCQ